MGRQRFSLVDDNLREFGIIVRRNLRFLIVFALVVAFLLAVITVCLPRDWKVSATVQVKGGYDASMLALMSVSGGLQLPSPASATEMQLLRSRFLKERAVSAAAMQVRARNLMWDHPWGRLLRFMRDKLPLVPDVPEEYVRLADAEVAPDWAGRRLYARVTAGGGLEIAAAGGGTQKIAAGGRFSTEGLAFTLVEACAPAGRRFALEVRPLRETIRQINIHSGVYELGLASGVLVDYLVWPEAHRAVDYVSAHVQAYLKDSEENRRTMGGYRLDFLDREIERVRRALAASEAELAQYKQRKSTVELTEQSKALISAYAKYKLESEEAAIGLAEAENLLARLSAGRTEDFLLYSTALNQDPVQVSLVQRLAQLEAQRASLLTEMTEAHPDVARVNSLMEEVKSSIVGNLRNRVKSLQSRRSSLGGTLSDYESQMLAIPERERDLVVLMRDQKVNENLYYFLMSKREETAVLVETQTSSIRLLDGAIIPDFPYRPSVRVNALLGLIIGLLFGLAYVCWRAYGSGKVRNVRHALTLGAERCLALLPQTPSAWGNRLERLVAEIVLALPQGGLVALVDLTGGLGERIANGIVDRMNESGLKARLTVPGPGGALDSAAAGGQWIVALVRDLVAEPLHVAVIARAGLRVLLAAAGETGASQLQANASLLARTGPVGLVMVASVLETEDSYSAAVLGGGEA